MSDDVRSTNPSLPRLTSRIKLYEKDGKIWLDISDSSGGLGLLLDLDPVVASQLGQKMADMARNLVAKVSTSKERSEIYSTTTKVDHNAFVQPARLPPDPQKSRRPHKSRSLRKKLENQMGLPGSPALRLERTSHR